MNLPRTYSLPTLYVSAATLQDALVDLSRAYIASGSDTSFVISIAGGSATGKSTIASQLAGRLGESQAVLFSQDTFQLGSEFTDRKVSPYKWDDPRNFDLQACEAALQSLRECKPAAVPLFDLVANKRQDTIVLPGRPIIIWEGVYAFLTPKLQSLADVSIFIDVPYALRLVRRISRFLERQEIADISVPARHMLSFVLLADMTFVATQRQVANIILKPIVKPADVSSEITAFIQRAQVHRRKMATLPEGKPLRAVNYNALTFLIYNDHFAITVGDNSLPVYATDMPADIVDVAVNNWDKLFTDID